MRLTKSVFPFLNRILRATVVVELNKGLFNAEFPCPIVTLSEHIDDNDRLEWENPPLCIILCNDAEKTFVEYAPQDYQRPMGVAQYKTHQLKELLPNEQPHYTCR